MFAQPVVRANMSLNKARAAARGRVGRRGEQGTGVIRVVAILGCCLALAACESLPSLPTLSMPSLSFGSSPPPALARIESEPPGADARTSTGQTCRTPCAVSIPATGNFTVNFTLNGYLPQAVSARVVAPTDMRIDAEVSTQPVEPLVVPNPIFAVLDPAPPPPPPRSSRQRR